MENLDALCNVIIVSYGKKKKYLGRHDTTCETWCQSCQSDGDIRIHDMTDESISAATGSHTHTHRIYKHWRYINPWRVVIIVSRLPGSL